ncbi:uncharacterized protein LOC144142066 isoform X2 [Haemaphysalis longicornis]
MLTDEAKERNGDHHWSAEAQGALQEHRTSPTPIDGARATALKHCRDHRITGPCEATVTLTCRRSRHPRFVPGCLVLGPPASAHHRVVHGGATAPTTAHSS